MHEYKQWVKLPVMARILSRSVKQFRADVKKYNIPCLELGRDRLFDPEKVTQYLSVKSNSSEQSDTVQSTANNSPAKKTKNSEQSETENRYKSLLGLE